MKVNRRQLSIWDIGGRKSIRRWWKEYYEGAVVIVFVVDSNDRDRLEEARDALHEVMDHDALKNAGLLVLANKHDLQVLQNINP
jgi:GTPase SAR1 family protein